MKKVLFIAVVALAFVAGSIGSANASVALVNPGTGVTDSPVGTYENTIYGSSFITSVTSPFSFGHISGSLYQEVRRDTSDGMLIFMYQLTNGSSSTDAISRLTSWDYDGFKTWMAYDNDSGAVAPVKFTRNASGFTIGFDFADGAGLPVNTTSYKMWVKTNAESYMDGWASVQDGGSQNVFAYVPNVPEPATAALLGIGLIGFAGRVIRRKFMA